MNCSESDFETMSGGVVPLFWDKSAQDGSANELHIKPNVPISVHMIWKSLQFMEYTDLALYECVFLWMNVACPVKLHERSFNKMLSLLKLQSIHHLNLISLFEIFNAQPLHSFTVIVQVSTASTSFSLDHCLVHKLILNLDACVGSQVMSDDWASVTVFNVESSND